MARAMEWANLARPRCGSSLDCEGWNAARRKIMKQRTKGMQGRDRRAPLLGQPKQTYRDAQDSSCQQPRFPNLPYSRSPKSAGRKAALEVGLEICAITRPNIVTTLGHHSLLPAIGKSRSRDGKLLMHSAYLSKDCTLLRDRFLDCII